MIAGQSMKPVSSFLIYPEDILMLLTDTIKNKPLGKITIKLLYSKNRTAR